MDNIKDRASHHSHMAESGKSENEKHHHKGRSSEKHLDRGIVLKELNLHSGQTILDAGCGSGYMSKEFSKMLNNTGRVFALDPDNDTINRLKEETIGTNIETIVGDITQRTPIEGASIDLIYLSNVFHGFSKNEIEGFQTEVKRLLKPSAVLAIVEFKKIETPFGPPLEIRYSQEELKKTIALTPKSFVEIGEFFYMQTFENINI
jgi:ubiquinone/menaquinone biosynthesis C-methylase UbiE